MNRFKTLIAATALAVPLAAAIPAEQASAATCYPAIVGSPTLQGGKTFCTAAIWWYVRIGCSTASSTQVVATVNGPKRYHDPSYAYCPSWAPRVRWVSSVVA